MKPKAKNVIFPSSRSPSYLGHVISTKGVEHNSKKLAAVILHAPEAHQVVTVVSLSGKASNYNHLVNRSMTPDVANIHAEHNNTVNSVYLINQPKCIPLNIRRLVGHL